jgi:hypothetical protein
MLASIPTMLARSQISYAARNSASAATGWPAAISTHPA